MERDAKAEEKVSEEIENKREQIEKASGEIF